MAKIVFDLPDAQKKKYVLHKTQYDYANMKEMVIKAVEDLIARDKREK